MRLAQVVLQFVIAQAGLGVVLNPLHAVRGEIGCRPQAGLVLEYLIGNVGCLEGVGLAVIAPAADGKDFAADFPDMGAAPLDDIAGCRQGAAEGVELLVSQWC